MKKIVSLICISMMTLFLSACSEIELGSHLYKKYDRPPPSQQSSKGVLKVGKPYNIQGTTYYPTETYNYVETGVSSWYGPGFHGKKTASGEIYNQNDMTAAHRTLQMPSLVRVTNLGNGKSVVVRVNDRGPFAKGRIIDVSERAANLLDMKGAGTARVKLELLSDESRALAEAARRGKSTKGVEVVYNQTGQLPAGYQQSAYTAPTGPVASDMHPTEADIANEAQTRHIPGHYESGKFYPNPVVQQMAVAQTKLYVQAGAFGQQDNANRLAQKLSHLGNAVVEPVGYSGQTLYKVRIGPLDNVGTADSVLSKVLASGQSDAIIVVQ